MNIEFQIENISRSEDFFLVYTNPIYAEARIFSNKLILFYFERIARVKKKETKSPEGFFFS